MNVHQVAAWVAALFLASSVFAHTVALRLLLLGVGMVLAAMVALQDREVRNLPPIWLPFLLWGTWALLSLAWSVEPDRTLKEWRNEVFYTGAALWICFAGAQARGALRVFLPVLALAAAAACTIALHDFSRGPERYEAGWHGGPGDHSSALLLLMPCAAMTGWYLHRSRAPVWQRALPWAVATLFLVSSYYTLNRTVWLGLTVEALLIWGLIMRHGQLAPDAPSLTAGRKLAASALAAGVLAAGLTLILHVHAERERAVDPGDLTRDSRVEAWRETAGWISQKPLTGYGFGRGLLRDALRVGIHSRNLWHAHNFFLDTVVQIGVPGLLLFVLLLAVIVREGWRLSRDGELGAAACGIALLGVVAGMVVRNMSDTLLVRQNALLFWGTVGVLLAWGARPWRA